MYNESFTTENAMTCFCAAPREWGVTTAVSYCIRFFFKFVIKTDWQKISMGENKLIVSSSLSVGTRAKCDVTLPLAHR